MRGETAGIDPAEFWQPVQDTSEGAWAEALGRLRAQEAELLRVVLEFPEGGLDARLTAEGSSAYNNFHGHVQHNAYHAGQIALLKRVLRGPS